MIKDAEKHPWDAVVVYKLDRFARNRYDSATYKNRLKKNGIKVISATENISENPEGVILEAVLEGMAEFYSKELSQKITRGMNESAKKCNSIGGHIALGYKIENKKLVVVESAAQIVREAFDLYAQGWTVADICTRFNNKGYRTAKGAEFNKNSFRSMFKNERYIGVYTYKDLRIEGGVPAIIDKETFETVQQRLVKNGMSPARGKAKVDYLLSGKLFCGHCGNKMVGESGTSKTGEIHNYYTCTTRKRQHTCDKKPVKKEEIERVVVENALALINPDTIEELAEMAVKAANEEIAKNTLLPSLEAEMQEIEKGIDNLVKMVEKGIVSESIENRIRELETSRKSTHRRILEAQADMLYLEKYQVIYWLEKFVKGDINDEEFRRDVIDMLINSVTIWDDPDGGWKITTAYNLTSVKSKTLHLTKEFGLKESCSTKNHSSSKSGFFICQRNGQDRSLRICLGFNRCSFLHGTAVGSAALGAPLYIFRLCLNPSAEWGIVEIDKLTTPKGGRIMLELNKKRQELMDKLVGLRYPAVALKMIEDEADVPAEAVRPMKDWGKHIALCQAFAFARRQDKIIYMEKRDHWCWNPILTYGMIDKELGKEGFRAMNRFMGAPEDSSDAFVESFPYLPANKYKGILVAPLTKADFQPDVTMIYCKNDQMRLFLMAVDSQTHKLLDSSFAPIDSCTYAVIPAILEGNYRITLPDPGEFERALTPEDDIIFSVPKQKEEEFYKGVEQQGNFGPRNSFFMNMKEDFLLPPIYNPLFETWGLDTGEVWDKK